jgi:alpha-amylase/alpha-mannosidase (GH57 family)
MPWVFLHAIKDYYDMPWILSQFPSLRASFNITPPLIEQLNLYSDPLANDYFLSLWYKHPKELDEQQREWITKSCKSANYEKMIRVNPYYNSLYYKESLSDSELIDMEVLYILAWCGEYLRINSRVVEELLKKERYTTEDKIRLFDVTVDLVAKVLPFYKSLQEEGIISISTTPYNHPILPLLIDMDNITKANPNSPKPNNPISLYDDASKQVERAIELYRETFGREPIGFWPAEGAVDEASVEIYKRFNIEWIATDEAILFGSIDSSNRSSLYKPYSINGVDIYFRDHKLSDLFGFDYRFKETSQAVEHFIDSIRGLRDEESLFIILDGENAWEYYERNGYPFLMRLYEEIGKLDWCKSVTMDSIATQKESIPLSNLASGSWIYGDFSTWSGDPQKNRAWELIFDTKRTYLEYSEDIDSKSKEQIDFHFLASECSDWFWWYGEGHTTSFAMEFDRLFRGHLISIYRLLHIPTPTELLVPIITGEEALPSLIEPSSLISPNIEAYSDLFGWIGAGVVYENRIFSTMDRVRGPIDELRFGFDKESLFLALDGEIDEVESITIHSTALTEPILANIHRGRAITTSIPLSLFDSRGKISMSIELKRGEEILQTLPGYGLLEIDIANGYEENWFI